MSQEIEINATYLHLQGNMHYKVKQILLDATGYESGKKPVEMVHYTQLDAGSYPVGTEWMREKNDFLEQFKKVD